ncbi:unnamed protein product [Haemonchus placei]|uniref:Uncharacterized protein n=1 Tax=Haemonchus placei TaxID=6290 RepID=A0A3P7YVI3_HAEPC|nr:unnamed protein product [Haemonchus placei]
MPLLPFRFPSSRALRFSLVPLLLNFLESFDRPRVFRWFFRRYLSNCRSANLIISNSVGFRSLISSTSFSISAMDLSLFSLIFKICL